MNVNNETLKIENFVLKTSFDITEVIKKISNEEDGEKLIHVVSFIHNTVLVQNLKKEIIKTLPNAKVVLLNHEDKNSTVLTLFTLKRRVDIKRIADEILQELHLDNGAKASSIREYRDQLFSRYFTDHLTNLPNIYQLRKDLEEKNDFGLVLLNIDNFQIINNFYGFMVGDYVLEQVAKYLKTNVSGHLIYKLSGDEFAIVLDESMGFYDLKEYLNRLYKELNNIIVSYQSTDIYVDLTLASCVHVDSSDVFSKVAMALRYAKTMGLAFWIYEDRMNFENEYERNLKFSGIVREAVENSNIVPYYQAIIDNKTSKIVKYECLARLIDSNLKVISPILFIPVAKKIKVYHKVTTLIIEKSFQEFENSDLEFNINLAIEDIMNNKIFKYIIEKLKTSNASSRVTFELLESEAIQDFKKVERFISEVKRYGAKIAIDDFGSGYSNFSYLTKMSPDYIKIDGSLIKEIDVDKNALIVVETIVSFAKKLGIKTVAEYVHSSSVLAIVKSLEIDYSQGFYIDEPSVNV